MLRSSLDWDISEIYPISMQIIQEYQEKGDDLRKGISADKQNDIFGSTEVDDVKIVTRKDKV